MTDTNARADVLYAADDNYVIPLSVSLRSLQEKASCDVRIAIACDHVSGESKQRILASVPQPDLVRFVDIDGAGLPAATVRGITTTYSRTAFARLSVAEMTVHPHRFVYLDSDTVVYSDIDTLLSLDVAGFILRAVRDDTYTLFARQTARIPDSDGPVSPCFNSGVLLINSAWWFGAAVGARSLKVAVERGISDQGALNIVCAGAWAELPREWNVTTQDLLRHRRRRSRPVAPHIRHLTAVKPWKREVNPNDIDRLLLQRYYEVLERTTWIRGET